MCVCVREREIDRERERERECIIERKSKSTVSTDMEEFYALRVH